MVLNIRKLKIGIILMLIINLIMVYLFYQERINKHKIVANYKTEVIKIDTIIKQVEREPIVLKKTKGNIIYTKNNIVKEYIRDTMFVEKQLEFKSCLDTIVKGDTISMCYIYPENIFDLKVLYSKDTIKTIVVEKLKEKKENHWQSIAIGAAALILGYLLGK